MGADDTAAYHEALDVLPDRVVDLARFLRTLSTREGEVDDDPLERAAYHEDSSGDLYLNWFGLSRMNLIPGMPAWKWRAIVAEVRDLWESNGPDPFAPMPGDDRHRGEVVAKLLLQRCSEFISRYLRDPRPIPLERADELTPRQWEVVILVCNQRLDVPEAAALLGIEPSTARKYLEEAAKALDMTVKELRRRRVAIPVDSPANRS